MFSKAATRRTSESKNKMTVNTPADPQLQRLIDRVKAAQSSATKLDIQSGNTKRFYGEPPQGEPFDVGGLKGISSYEPSELVVTARCGTPLRELEAALAEKGQCLPNAASACPSSRRISAPRPPSAAWWQPGLPDRRAQRPAACATTCSAPPCSTVAARC